MVGDISDELTRHISNATQTHGNKSSQMAKQDWNMWFITHNCFVTWRPTNEAI